MKALCLALLMVLASAVGAQETYTLNSPDGRVTAQLLKDGNYWHLHALAGEQLMADATLGLTVSGYRFMTGLTCDSVSAPAYLEERYTAVHGKRSQVSNEANTQRFFFTNSTKKTLQLEVRAYNDGITFRYHIGATDATSREFSSEATAYTIPDEAKRWLQSFSTSYEGDYPLQQGAEQQGAWGYPALFQCAGSYALITETISDATYCATHLDNTAKANTYKVTYPYAWEGNNTGDANPKSTMPWTSPWRVIIMGDLATVMQSTLVEDVSPATTMDDVSWIEPASAAWIYWAYNHGTKDYQLCKEYVDLATTMGWKYVLFDWEWDQMSNGGNLEDVCRYATDNGIKPLLWYNSGGPHNQVGSTPRDRMLTHESRCKEFEWLKSIGIVGVKIDFFESDKQNMMQYYLDILRDAADYHMLVNFHGCTVPRGWSRTWPHLMSMEAVHGAEQYNNGGNMTNIAPRLNCTLPFTRNVVGPMDYTPVAFTNSQYPHLTTSAHELALSVVFESGIQHWADRPSGFYNLPALAKRHMSEVPTAWDETLLLQGHPGTDVVVARRKGSLWYVGGLNGEDYRKNYTIDFSFLPADKDYVATLLADGTESNTFRIT
ncbi:MAG: glycoside hydrolase family 97 catalytic domain-containing protein, partial [Bacteroidaceae bacterium]|nr:glycoside hydrolase family 97 catalytic domain-containing protein [Bacteroidaceae bacterium]